MGASSMHRERGLKTIDVLRDELLGTSGQYGEFLASRNIGGVVYIAHRCGSAHGEDAGKVRALVVITSWSSGHWNWTYKAQTEEMGPCDDDCPRVILDLLDPIDNDYANAWRQRCRAKAAA